MIILGLLRWVDRSSWKAVEGSGLLGSKRIISSGHLHCPLSGATSRLPTQVSRQGAKLTRDPEKSAQMAQEVSVPDPSLAFWQWILGAHSWQLKCWQTGEFLSPPY